MQSDNQFFNDFTKVMTGFWGTAQGLQKEACDQFKQQIENMILNAGFVRKQDHDILEERVNLLSEKIKTIEDQISNPST